MTQRLKIKTTLWTPENDARLRQLWDDNRTMRQIGNVIGCTRCAVAGRVRRLGLSSRKAIGNRLNENIPDIVTRFTPVRKEREKMSPLPAIEESTSETNVTLLESLCCHCKWIMDVDGSEEPIVCGGKALNGPYCEAHRAKAFQPSSARRDNEKQLNWRSRI